MRKKPRDLTVGEAVYFLREKAVGIIYETYTFVDGPGARPGVSVLLSDGKNLSGFSATEADYFLEPVGHTGLEYDFQNVGQLAQDFRRGVFDQAFTTARLLAGFKHIDALNTK